jgi:hypothetical protein
MTGETGSPAIPREAPWTEEQWDAITTRHRNLLVSAAAGAGKTAVLVRRVIFLLVPYLKLRAWLHCCASHHF